MESWEVGFNFFVEKMYKIKFEVTYGIRIAGLENFLLGVYMYREA